MVPSTARTRIVQGLKISLHILQDVSDDLPAPASTIVNIAQSLVIVIEVCCTSGRALESLLNHLSFQTVQSNRDECELLETRVLEIVSVVLMVIQPQVTGVDDPTTLPPSLKQNVERLQT